MFKEFANAITGTLNLESQEKSNVHDLDALTLLEKQHREVEDLFERILDEDRADEVLSKRDLVKKVIQSLELHAVLEEKHIYPLIKEFDEMKAFEAIEEHALVKAMISSLRKTRQDGSLLTARVKVLEEIVSHHVKEEENDLFPQLRQEVEADKLRLVGARMLKTMKSHKEVGKDAGKTVSKGRTKRTASRTAARTTRKTVRKAARKTPLRKAG